eukprot:6699498-Pyramimonas_sp.AAC.1
MRTRCVVTKAKQGVRREPTAPAVPTCQLAAPARKRPAPRGACACRLGEKPRGTARRRARIRLAQPSNAPTGGARA